MTTQRPLTPEQVKANFEASGIVIAHWAAEHGFSSRAVYQVLNGFTKAKHGTGHKIAVALGIKNDDQHRAA